MTEDKKSVDIKCSMAFKQFMETAKDEDKAKVMTVFDGTAFQLSLIEPGAGRAKVMHALSDAMQKGPTSSMYREVSCKSGCANCCFPQAHATRDEAKLLAQVVKSGKVQIDFKKLEEAALYEGSHGDWIRKREPCVFLGEDKMCRVYDERPLTCRNYYVRSNPIHCATDFPSQVLNNPWVESVAAACATVAGDGPLPKLVYEELKKDGWIPDSDRIQSDIKGAQPASEGGSPAQEDRDGDRFVLEDDGA